MATSGSGISLQLMALARACSCHEALSWLREGSTGDSTQLSGGDSGPQHGSLGEGSSGWAKPGARGFHQSHLGASGHSGEGGLVCHSIGQMKTGSGTVS